MKGSYQALLPNIKRGMFASTSCTIMQLVDEAFQRWLMEEEGVVDDITAVVVRFSYEE